MAFSRVMGVGREISSGKGLGVRHREVRLRAAGAGIGGAPEHAVAGAKAVLGKFQLIGIAKARYDARQCAIKVHAIAGNLEDDAGLLKSRRRAKRGQAQLGALIDAEGHEGRGAQDLVVLDGHDPFQPVGIIELAVLAHHRRPEILRRIQRDRDGINQGLADKAAAAGGVAQDAHGLTLSFGGAVRVRQKVMRRIIQQLM